VKGVVAQQRSLRNYLQSIKTPTVSLIAAWDEMYRIFKSVKGKLSDGLSGTDELTETEVSEPRLSKLILY
jgi:hypothetical protein